MDKKRRVSNRTGIFKKAHTFEHSLTIIVYTEHISPRATGFLYVLKGPYDRSSTYGEIFSGNRICASYKNHP